MRSCAWRCFSTSQMWNIWIKNWMDGYTKSLSQNDTFFPSHSLRSPSWALAVKGQTNTCKPNPHGVYIRSSEETDINENDQDPKKRSLTSSVLTSQGLWDMNCHFEERVNLVYLLGLVNDINLNQISKEQNSSWKTLKQYEAWYFRGTENIIEQKVQRNVVTSRSQKGEVKPRCACRTL